MSTIGISNVQSLIAKDSIFSTASGIQNNYYNVRAATDACELCWTSCHVLTRVLIKIIVR